jgi:hypothetical protein
MSVELKKSIEAAVQGFAKENLTRAALSLFETLGYDTSRQASLPSPTTAEFKVSFVDGNSRFNDDKALCKEWTYVDLLFQLSKDEVTRQHSLFDTKQVDRTILQA